MIKKILLAIPRLVHWIIVTILQVLSTLIIALGLILMGIAFYIKNPKTATLIIKATIKKILENGTKV